MVKYHGRGALLFYVLLFDTLGEAVFCFLQIRQPHTRDQRPKKALVLRLRAEYLKLRD